MPSISPQAIYEFVNKKVIGQDEAKKVIAASVFLHVVRYTQSLESKEPMTCKTNTLLMGPTGSGKTFIVRQASEAVREILGYPICPLLEVDATEITARGWEGENFSDIIKRHYSAVGGNEAEFNSSIVFLDEIDKLCKPGTGASGTEHNKASQYSLLKMIEGCKIDHHGRKIDTSKMLFLLAGNFSEVRDARTKRDSQMGFPTGAKAQEQTKYIDYHTELDNAGMVSQLVGRIGTVGELAPLSQKDLENILVQNAIPEYEKTWQFLGRELFIPPTVKKRIAKTCFERRTGGRGIASELAKYLEKELFDMELKL